VWAGDASTLTERSVAVRSGATLVHVQTETKTRHASRRRHDMCCCNSQLHDHAYSSGIQAGPTLRFARPPGQQFGNAVSIVHGADARTRSAMLAHAVCIEVSSSEITECSKALKSAAPRTSLPSASEPLCLHVITCDGRCVYRCPSSHPDGMIVPARTCGACPWPHTRLRGQWVITHDR
jgi:hypothetical protein